MGVSFLSAGGVPYLNLNGPGYGEVDWDGVAVVGASNTPSYLGVESECSTAWGPNAINLQLPQGPSGMLAAVWSAGFKKISDSANVRWLWQYMQAYGARISDGEIMMGPTLTLGRAISDGGRKCAIIEHGHGGTSAFAYANRSEGSEALQTIQSNYNRFAGGLTMRAIMLMLGGNDADVLEYANTFEDNLVIFSTRIRALPIAGISTARVYLPFRTDVFLTQPYGATVLAQGASFCSNPANNAEALDLDPLWPNTPAYIDGLHFTTAALQIYGQFAGETMLAAFP